MDREALMAWASTAFRNQDARGQVLSHPAWHDLEEPDRVQLHEDTTRLRTLEAALDPDGLSTTAHAVLAKIRGT